MSPPHATRGYKLLPRTDWAQAMGEGVYRGSGIDLQDGYIHLSTADQAGETARRHFAGLSDLVLLEIDLPALGEALRWEPSRDGALFPHLYGVLDPKAVLDVRALVLNGQGWPDPGPLTP